MPWEVSPVSELRLAFVHQVVTFHSSVTEACRKFGISRKTGYKWLQRYRAAPDQSLADHSRRPQNSPRHTVSDVEARILEVRRAFGWGPRKIRAFLHNQGVVLPSIRTVGNILHRCGAIPAQTEPLPCVQSFERSAPNQLWQCDHKGPVEVARQKVHPLTVLDDHSRFLIALTPCLDLTMKTAFAVLWDAFGEFGLPDSILCDNAFGSNYTVPKTLSWFDAQLIRLGITPIHGRPYHPQTQGKVERLHGTFERELWPTIRRDSLDHFASDLTRFRCQIYNTQRPHEALGDRPPLSRYLPSPRPRPAQVPPVEYPAGSVLRIVARGGDISYAACRILVGAGLVKQAVRIEDHGHEIRIFYAWKQIRCLAKDQLHRNNML
jgi:transposase InsO family protein